MTDRVNLQVRLRGDLHEQAVAQSTAAGISLNEWVNRALTFALAAKAGGTYTRTTTEKVTL